MMHKILTLSLMLALTAVLAAGGTVVTSGAANAQSATPLGQFKDWGAYVAESGGGKVCYALSQPKSTTPANVNRDPKKTRAFRPKDFNPYERAAKSGMPITKGNIGVLKQVFVKEERA